MTRVYEREVTDCKGRVVLQVIGNEGNFPWRGLKAESIRCVLYPEHNKTFIATMKKIPRKM